MDVGPFFLWDGEEDSEFFLELVLMANAPLCHRGAALSRQILTFQGDGDYDGVAEFVDKYLIVGPQLKADLDRVAEAGIPVDIVFEQGVDVLGL